MCAIFFFNPREEEIGWYRISKGGGGVKTLLSLFFSIGAALAFYCLVFAILFVARAPSMENDKIVESLVKCVRNFDEGTGKRRNRLGLRSSSNKKVKSFIF